jgi:NAD(P)-dependent dehydrogenase (short-subunit alcohol dehydrogenase family)
MLLENKIALVTAAGSGIGQAGAKIMARNGAMVVVTDRDGQRADDTAKMIQAEGGLCESACLDVTADSDISKIVEKIMASHGRLDVLHSHAGIQVEGTVEQIDVDGFDASWAINVRAHFMLIKSVLGMMREAGGGSIIVTASNSGVLYDREMVAYATSKHACVAMVKQIAADYAAHNIRVNALCPGWIDTPFNDPFTRQMGGREALLDYVSSAIPMRRFGNVEEIAEAILFLASSKSSFMTGQAFVVDGGEAL